MAQRLLGSQLRVSHEVLVGHRAYQCIADKSQYQQAGKDVQGNVVHRRTFHTQRQLVFTQVGNQHRPQHAGRGPGGQKTTVNGANHLRAEQVGQIRRYGSEAAAVHRQDDAKRRHKQGNVAQVAHVRHQCIQGNAQGEEGKIGVLAPDIVGERGPEKPPANVEQAQQPGKPGSDCGNLRQLRGVQLAEAQIVAEQFAGEHFLQQR
ncbi:hypothetical protein D3C77_485910 [compost metagenome]